MEKKIEINKSKAPPKASSAGNLTSKKQLDKIEINPTVPSPVSEQAGNAVVLTFGRFNPPTIGHQKLVEAVKKIATAKKAKPLVYLSHSQDSKKNPLSYKDKMKYAREAFGDLMHVSKAKTIIEVLKELQTTYKNVTVVVGSDRVNEFNTLLNKYNGKEYKFDSIVVESAGERDPDAEGVAGMSASKMRLAVKENDMKAFKSGLPTKLRSSANEIFELIKTEMHIAEEMEAELASEDLLNEAVLNLQQRQKRKIIMRKYKAKLIRARKIAAGRMANKQKLMVRAQKMARDVARMKFAGERGVKYHELGPSDKIAVDKLIDKKGALIKRIASRLLPIVQRKEVQRLQSFRSGQAMKSVHSPVAEGVKDTSDYKIVIDKEGNKRKVKAHRIELGTEEMITFKEMSQQARKRGRPAKPETLAKRAAMAKAKAKEAGEDEYGPDNGREPDQNIIVQLQKAITMNGKKEVEFDQGKPVMVTPAEAEKALKKYHSIKKPADKLEFIKMITHSHDAMKKLIGEQKDDTDELLMIIENVMDRIEMTEISEEAVDGLKKKAAKSGVSLSILKQVFKRGMGAWKQSHRPGTTPQQWAFARVNSFLSGGKTRTTADADLWAKVRKESVDEACWTGYKQVGLKDKNGKKVPNCVPTNESILGPGNYQVTVVTKTKDGKEHTAVHKVINAKNRHHAASIGMNRSAKKHGDQLHSQSGQVKKLEEAFKMPKETAAEKLYRKHQELRKKSGLPDPEEYKKKIAQKQKEIDALKNEEIEINEDAASHLRAAAAAMKKGKPVVAAIHKKIASALQRGDNTTAQGFKRQLQNAKAKKANESINEQIEWNVVDYSDMKPTAAPTVAEMKDFMRAQGGFEHHPEVKKIMSMKEMREIKAAGLIAKDGNTPVRNRMENDPEDQIFVGSYRSRHFEASPQAQKLYMNLPKGTDPNAASLAAIEQDHLFQIFKKVAASHFATPEDVQSAKQHAAKTMKFAADMNLERQHSYILDMVRKITDAGISDLDRVPPAEHLPDDPRFQSLPKNLNQEPGPGNDKDIDNMSNYLISRNIKAQRKLKIIDAD